MIVSTPRPARRWRRRLLLTPALAAAGLWGYVAWHQYRAGVRLADALAEADRLDPGWRIEDIQAHRAVVPDDRNAAPRILALLAKLPANYPNYDLEKSLDDLDPPARHSASQRADLARLLAPVATLLPEARALADLPAGRFPLTLTPSFIGARIQSLEARSLLRPLGYDFLDRLEAGDTAGALTAWRAAFNVGRAIGDEPLIVSQMTRANCRSTAVEMLERLLAQSELGDTDLARVQRLLEDDEAAPLFLYAARGERAGGYQTIEEVKANVGQRPTWKVWWSAVESVWDKRLTVDEAVGLLPGSMPGAQAALLRHETRLVEIARRPVEEWGPALDGWNAEAQRLPGLARMLAPAPGKVGATFRRSHAELRCATAAVAAERYRRRTGRWPAAWDELVRAGLLRAAPTDPFDGRPLRLKPVADGLLVYSISVDGADDGGNLNRKKVAQPGFDLGFRLWNADRRRQPAPAK